MRLYLESSKTPLRFAAGERLTTPCAIAHFPLEAPFPPRSWIERVYDVKRWSEFPVGGHFAALEQPELFAEDLKIALSRACGAPSRVRFLPETASSSADLTISRRCGGTIAAMPEESARSARIAT